MSFLSELDEVVWWALDQHGVDADTARRVSDSLGALVRSRWGGERLYVPAKPDRTAMVAKIERAYDGTNRDSLCRQMGVSRATFYRLKR